MAPTVAPMWHHPRMETNEFIAALERDSAAFVDACAVAGLSVPVPSCPAGRSPTCCGTSPRCSRLLGDGGRRAAQQPGRVTKARPARSTKALAQVSTGRTDLLQTLSEVDPAMPMWTWSSDKTAGFVIRRMTHETAVHLLGRDRGGRNDQPDRAHARQRWHRRVPDALHVRCCRRRCPCRRVGSPPLRRCAGGVDGEGERGWFRCCREHSKGDCAIRGTASDILLALWRRQPLSACDVVGDADVAADSSPTAVSAEVITGRRRG